MKCSHCLGEHPDDAGGYYDQKACRARHIAWLVSRIEAVGDRASERQREHLRYLRAELERARYVGD